MSKPAVDLSKRETFIVQQLKDQLALGRTLQEAKLRFLELFEEVEIDRAIDAFKASDERFKSAKEISTLHDQPNYAGWYPGPDASPRSVWSGLTRTLKEKGWSDLTIESLDISSTGVVEQLAPPMSEKPIRVKGLVLGHVQSGKTANYSAVVAKSVDAGYRLIIILSGMHNNLRKQTQARLKAELVDPNPAGCTTLTSVDEQGDFQKKQNVVASRALSVQGFTLVVLKKNSSVLRNFHAWLDGASEDVIQKTPTIIIDDESDQASINTSKPEDDPTAINKHIRKLMTRFHACTYVGYTATPFANVLVDANEDSDVFPRDFLISLGKPPTYFGAEELFGREKVGALPEKSGAPVIRLIPPEEAAKLSAKHLKKQIEDESKGSSLMGPSMEIAIDGFILGCAARFTRGQHKKHMTMLLHVSHLTDVQARLQTEVNAHLVALKFAAENNDQSLLLRLQNLWEDDFQTVSRTFEGTQEIEFDKVWKYAKRVIGEIDTVLENSKSLERLSFEGDDPLRTIVIGGNTLSRGLTMEGLTASYFIRTSKAYDTLLQMGRWFGYRPGYIDLTRIFVTEDLRDHFYHLATVEQEVRDEIRMMAANDERPIDVGVRIRNHPHLTVTASNKMRKAQDCAFTYSGTKIQARHVITQDPEAVASNYTALKDLLDRCQKFGKKESSGLHDFRNAHLFRNLSQEVILQFLDEYLFSPENGKFTNELLKEYITKQNQVDEVRDWSVAFLSSHAGDEVALGNTTLRVFERSCLKRVFEDSSSTSVQLRGLSVPGEELIDLYDHLGGEVKKIEDLLPEGKERESEIALRRKFRPPERGLLLIHPLNWKQSAEAGMKFALTEPLTARGPVFGITFVFPFSKQDQSKYGFVSNRTVVGPKLVPADRPQMREDPPQADPKPPVIIPPESSFSSVKRLSKSQYVKGRKCLKRVWLYNHKRELADAPTEMQEQLFRQGNEVGVLAQKYFTDGHLIGEDFKNSEAALAHTQDALKNSDYKVLFEAAFLFEDILIRVDALRKNPDGSVDLIEVKSTNSVKKEHKDDVAVQKYVLESLGYEVKASYLMHLNGDFVRKGELDLKELFVLEPMDEEIENLVEEVPNYLKLIRSKLSENQEPTSPIGSVCKSPYVCEFKSHCWKNVGKDSFHTLTRITDKKRADLNDLRVATLAEIPDTFDLSDSQRIQVQVAKTGKVHLEREKIEQHLEALAWPLHFLDYETIPYAIPRYDQSSPYQQLPFQFSLHVQAEPNGPLTHFEFLHREATDPRSSFVENLFKYIDGDRGSIVVFHAGFERSITAALTQVHPEYSEAFEEVGARMWDLEIPFAKRWYCDARFQGSSSIKYVLPVLAPTLSYGNLEIQKGDIAQKKYGEMVEHQNNEEREKIAKALLEYCKLDTFAMTEILNFLLKVCRR